MSRSVVIDKTYHTIFRSVIIGLLILYCLVLLLDIAIILTAPFKIALLLGISFLCACIWFPLTVYGIKKFSDSFILEFKQVTIIAWLTNLLSPVPICLYLLVRQDWSWVIDYGWDGICLSFSLGNWFMPLVILLFVSTLYTLLLWQLVKHSELYIKCKEKTKEIYE